MGYKAHFSESIMMNSTLLRLWKKLAPASAFVLWALASHAQLATTPPPPKLPLDTRVNSFSEDWTSPALVPGALTPAHPVVGFVTDNPHCTVELLQVEWRLGDPIDLYVMKPKGVHNPPVILYLYGYPTETDIFRSDEYEELVTKDGFAAVGFVSALTGHRYHDRPMKEWFVSELQETLATSAHDVQMVLNYLASRGDLDMNRIGMFTQGSGASIAILASAVDPRIKVLEALDPWADWPTWMATSPFVPQDERAQYITPDFLQKALPLEPLDWLPKIQAAKFRLDLELFETVTPPGVKEKLRSAVPRSANVALYKNMEEFKVAFQGGKNLEWIRQELRALPSETHN